jgi:hemolysin III
MQSTHEKPHRVPFASFFLWTGAQFALFFLALWLIVPTMLSQELAQPGSIVLWTFLLGLPLSAFEYFYHRYLLHSAVLPFMAAMHRAHSTHHGLTAVKAPVNPKDPETLVPVHSEYPVEEAHQEESMMFPAYSISIFYGIFLLLIALPLKLIFPEAPIVVSVIFVTTLQYALYEFWHAITHLPYERFWKPFTEHKRFGWLGRRIYSFHLMHHWRPSTNLAVVGFWGVAIWDYAFRTHRRPKRLPVPGAEVNFTDAAIKKPLFPVSMLDRFSGPLYKGSRRLEAFLARVFLRRRSSHS